MKLSRLGSAPTTPTSHDDSKHSDGANQKTSQKGQANGYASLDSSTLVPRAQLGTGTPDGTKVLKGDGTWGTGGGGGSNEANLLAWLGMGMI